MVGSVGVGGNNPVRLQSMTINDTMQTEAVVSEAIELFKAGAEIIRVTAPSKADAANIANIRQQLTERGFDFPICADIHFAPQAAMVAVEYAEKVRINPGNFADSKRFKTREYSDAQYQEELDRIHETFKPLVLRAKELGRAMRIGANHGSLSDRILNRYGDTPAGMVESALEFIRVARLYDYHQMIISMKASNPVVMVQAYRLLVEKMLAEGFDYPLHLGVTEAGDGRDARIKSSVGIGSLLEDGIGDTIRVSLTEDSVHELPPARMIAKRSIRQGTPGGAVADYEESFWQSVNPYEFERRHPTGIQLGQVSDKVAPVRLALLASGATGNEKGVDFLVDESANPQPRTNARLQGLNIAPGRTELPAADVYTIELNAADCGNAELARLLEDTVHAVARVNPVAIVSLKRTDYDYERPLATDLTQLYRLTFGIIRKVVPHQPLPLLVRLQFRDEDEAVYAGALHGGGLLLDGLVDGILVAVDGLSGSQNAKLGLDFLQSVRLRMTRTEFISCPSCGRTLFDLQLTTARIKARTNHLGGVKIAIMGCIVNGPGEMADADFGYVGAGPGRVHLYREKELVKANVPSDQADEELVNLIKEHGMWREPPAES